MRREHGAPPALREGLRLGGGIVLLLTLVACESGCPPEPQAPEAAAVEPGARTTAPRPPLPPRRGGTFLDELNDRPDRPPPPLPPDAPLVRLRARLKADGQWEGSFSGVQGTARDLDRIPWKAAPPGERPDYWIVVSAGAPGPRYWVGVPDPRIVLVERMANRKTGELRGQTEKAEVGFLSRRLPFFPNGEVRIYAAGLHAGRTQAVASFTYGASPPQPPQPVIQ